MLEGAWKVRFLLLKILRPKTWRCSSSLMPVMSSALSKKSSSPFIPSSSARFCAASVNRSSSSVSLCLLFLLFELLLLPLCASACSFSAFFFTRCSCVVVTPFFSKSAAIFCCDVPFCVSVTRYFRT